MEDLDENPMVQVALKIILAAGEARTRANEALDALAKKDYQTARDKIAAARNHIIEAHEFQTEIIQAEASGEHFDPCLIFNHAQDTLMTIMSEVNISERMLVLFEAFFEECHEKE